MNTRKLFIITLLLLPIFVLTGCTTDDANSLEQEEQMEQDDAEISELFKDDEDFAVDYAKELENAENEEELLDQYNLAVEISDSEDEKLAGENIKGSCDAINKGSVCIEYYGSFWTEAQMENHCSDTGTFSHSSCPKDMSGGCNTGTTTAADMVTWMYTRGGGEMTASSMQYAKMACDATPASQWISR